MENGNNKMANKFTNIMSKTSDLSKKAADFGKKAADMSKKAADELQKSAKELGEQTQKTLYDQRMKHYNPLFREEFFHDEFRVPNVIKIVDATTRRGIDVCEGAIGWTEKVKGVDVLFVYDEFVPESKIKFVPFVKCDTVYCVDIFECDKYISSDTIFDSAMNEKTAELEQVAYCLGAKNYSIEFIETNSALQLHSLGINANSKNIGTSFDELNFTQSNSFQRRKNVTNFEQNKVLREPILKWFKNDEILKNLIAMRLSGDSTIKRKHLTFQGAFSETISEKNAMAIDVLIKGGALMEKRVKKERTTSIILDIEF